MIEVPAKKRDIFGKKVRTLRKRGVLPAVVYGPKHTALPLSLAALDFKKIWKEAGETSVISLMVEGGKPTEAMIHEVSYDAVSGEPIHVDFYAIEAGKTLTVSVPLIFVGAAPAVRELGGTLVKVIHEIEIEALPKDIPREISVDVSGLETFDSHLTVGSISLPKTVKILTPAEEVIVLVAAPRQEEAEELPQEVDLSKIEVEKKGKKEEEISPEGAEDTDKKE